MPAFLANKSDHGPVVAETRIVTGSARPTWLVVLTLAWPVWLQQMLVLTVTLSDSFLAGHYQPLPIERRAEAMGHDLLAVGALLTPGPNGAAAPVAAEMPFQAARHILSRHVSYQAAQTTAHYLAWFINSYAILVSVGSTALVARFVGARDWASAIHATNQSIELAVALGVAGTVAGLVGMPMLIRILQLRGDAAELAVAYLRPLFALLVFPIVEAAGIACLVGAGDTKTGFFVLGGVALLNLPLAWGFFHGVGSWHGFGFEGIAIGTALSQTVGGTVVLCVLARGRAGLRLMPALLVPHWPLLRRLLRVSIPAGIDSLSLVVGQFWFLSIVNRLGDVAGSAHGIALRWEALGYLSGAAFGTAAMTLVGQNLGAREPAQAARSGWVAFALGCGVMTFMGAVFYTLAPEMFRLFCPETEQRSIVEAGVPMLRLVAFGMPPLASCLVFTYALRGAGDTRIPVLFTWIGFLGVRIPLAYYLTSATIDLGAFGILHGPALGLLGAWLAMLVDLVARGTFFFMRFARGRWKLVQV